MSESQIFVNYLLRHAMISEVNKRVIAAPLLCTFLITNPMAADDGAASIAAGGIVMTHEPRIVMAKEVLFISTDKVAVDYEFRNDTDAEIRTVVAFPVPDYSLAMEDRRPSQQGFDDFKLWVDGKLVPYTTEAKAIVNGKDYSALLRSMGVDVASYGQSTDNDTQPQIQRLSAAQKDRLAKAGVIDKEFHEPNWKVRKKYYWTQMFPPRSMVHIRHEYTPVLGSTNSVRYGLLQAKEDPDSAKELASLCIDPTLRRTLTGYVMDEHNSVPFSYVDFILTTANTWKTPIEDFTLVIGRPDLKDAQQNFVSFCWDGPVVKSDDDHFTAHTTNLVPKKELRIGFISVYKGRN